MTKIVCISDVQLGYGSPQIGKLVETLSQFYNAKSTVIVPVNSKNRKPKITFKEFNVEEILVDDPYSLPGRSEYNKLAAKLTEKLNPDILIICTTFNLSVLFDLEKKPKFVIYYYLETAMVYGQKDTEMNKKIGNLVDLIIFTEENRAKRFGEVCGFQEIPFSIVYNCVNNSKSEIIPSDQRNGRFLYQGTIRDDASSNFFLNAEIQHIPIDIYGNIDKNSLHFENDFARLHENIQYKGYIPSEALAKLRAFYNYSLIMWNPINENNLYASPNKFFESIASGIPPISTPNPQCEMITNRYDCGLIMIDWNFNSFRDSLLLGMEFLDTSKYQKMIQNCLKAVKEELNWEYQINKIRPFLKSV